jgi:hypothetical protein
MSITNVLLLTLLVVLFLILSPNLRRLAATGVCFWVWIASLALSGIAGLIGGYWLARVIFPDRAGAMAGFYIPITLLALPFTLMIVSVLTFIVAYCLVGFGIFSLIERNRQVELARPSVKLGLFFAAVSPFIILIFISAFRVRQ